MGQLDSELSRLSLRLIEKESELHAKTAYCHQLELKLAKTHQDVKKIGDDYGARLKAHQIESSRQEAAILDYAEKLRKVQVCVFYFAHESCSTLTEFFELVHMRVTRWKSNAWR